MTAEDERIAQKIKALEDQVQLLWEVILKMPRLEGAYDTMNIEAMMHKIKPMRFPYPEPKKP